MTTRAPSSPAFNRHAASYDATRRGLIPCFDALYGAAFEMIADWRGGGAGPLRALDLGAGTGLFSAMLLERYPGSAIRLLDASEAMLEQARERFAGHPAISFALGDMATADISGPWDLVISALAIHHLEDNAKQALFRRIHAGLRPGGLFVNAEQVLGPTPRPKTATPASGSNRSVRRACRKPRSPRRRSGCITIAALRSRANSPGCARPASAMSIAASKPGALRFSAAGREGATVWRRRKAQSGCRSGSTPASIPSSVGRFRSTCV
jgi:SAM-dependent methyltransferase